VTYDRWLSPGTPISFTYKTDHFDIAEIFVKVALNIINLTPPPSFSAKQADMLSIVLSI
jgi:hypothetical protein